MMNDLEKALCSTNNYELDSYLDIETTNNIRNHINEIKVKATIQTPAGEIKLKLEELIGSL